MPSFVAIPALSRSWVDTSTAVISFSLFGLTSSRTPPWSLSWLGSTSTRRDLRLASCLLGLGWLILLPLPQFSKSSFLALSSNTKCLVAQSSWDRRGLHQLILQSFRQLSIEECISGLWKHRIVSIGTTERLLDMMNEIIDLFALFLCCMQEVLSSQCFATWIQSCL